MAQVYTSSMPVRHRRRGDREHAAVGRLQRLALAAPEIAAAARPGQFVMVKPSRGMDPLLRRPFSIFEDPARRDGAPTGISHPQQAHRRRHRRCSTRSKPGARVACLGPLGRPFEPVDPPARGVDGGRRRRPGAVRDAGRSARWRAARRRRSSTARGGAPSCTASTRSSALGVAGRARDRGRQPRRDAAASPSPLERRARGSRTATTAVTSCTSAARRR